MFPEPLVVIVCRESGSLVLSYCSLIFVVVEVMVCRSKKWLLNEVGCGKSPWEVVFVRVLWSKEMRKVE